MSLHIDYNHECPKCAAYYIPYDQDVPCPQCGNLETERFDRFIAKAAGSVGFNFYEFGRYLPPAWYVSSLGDHILGILFPVLEAHRTNEEGKEFSAVCREVLATIDWENQLYLRDHIAAIAQRVHEDLVKNPPKTKEECRKRRGPVRPGLMFLFVSGTIVYFAAPFLQPHLPALASLMIWGYLSLAALYGLGWLGIGGLLLTGALYGKLTEKPKPKPLSRDEWEQTWEDWREQRESTRAETPRE